LRQIYRLVITFLLSNVTVIRLKLG
jgi:hypothetical protein